MEKIFFVKMDKLTEVNKLLQNGGRVKMIEVVQQKTQSPFISDNLIYAYIVVEYD